MAQIVILGGGTAGWMTAAYLAARLNCQQDPELKITLVESQDIPTIGVGEATTPSLRSTLAETGLDEYDFMRACNATFKHGIWFANWTHSPEHDPKEGYFHPFERPLRAGSESLAAYWLQGLDPQHRDFAAAVSIQQAMALQGKAPKRFEDGAYSGPIPYAYHLDAGLLGDLLKNVAKQRGVAHKVDQVVGVECHPSGAIAALQLSKGDKLSGDFFIDCSGFAAVLIERQLKAEFVDASDQLFCDRAVTCQVPHDLSTTIKPFTTSTALANGWIWDIGLTNRRGVGHVYSSNHISDEHAERQLRDYIGPPAEQLSSRMLKFRVGYRPQQWLHNCAAVGLASGFIEPLESTGIHMVEQAIWALASMLPRFFAGEQPQNQFNQIMARQYEMVIDFVKYHYAISQRSDSAFWCDNTQAHSSSQWLNEKMQQWRTSLPDIYDMRDLHSIFDYASYQYVYLGMQGRPQLSPFNSGRRGLAANVFTRVHRSLDKAARILPGHNAVLARIAEQAGMAQLHDSGRYAQVNASVMNIPSNYTVR